MPKAKERYEAIKRELLEEKKRNEVEYTHNVYDVIKNEEGKYEVVHLLYDPKSGSAKLEKLNLIFDSPAKAEYNSNNMNVAERIARLKTGRV